jgi:hypothetical protein
MKIRRLPNFVDISFSVFQVGKDAHLYGSGI